MAVILPQPRGPRFTISLKRSTQNLQHPKSLAIHNNAGRLPPPAWRKEQKTMSKTYALADLHGRFDLLEMALARITEHAEPRATVVTLGDYVDRGPDSRKIIERLMAGLGGDGWRLICLKGNHEDIMWQTCRRLPDVDWWLTNGGGATLIS